MYNQRKKIYVNGGIAIMTPFFRYQNVEALYGTPPEGSEQIECDSQIEGEPCILIEENKAPSIFNDYYAKTFFSTLYEWAPFFHKTYDDCYKEYQDRVVDAVELTTISNVSQKVEQILLRQVYLSIIASVDTFICDTILTKITSNKEDFYTYFQEQIQSKGTEEAKQQRQEALDRMWINNEMGNAEQKVFDNVLKISYANIDTIKSIYKQIFGISVCDIDGKMRKHFFARHVLAHRNGRKKDGQLYEFSKNEIMDLIADVNAFVKQIMDKLNSGK